LFDETILQVYVYIKKQVVAAHEAAFVLLAKIASAAVETVSMPILLSFASNSLRRTIISEESWTTAFSSMFDFVLLMHINAIAGENGFARTLQIFTRLLGCFRIK
jgi:hypothetical protein